jgi:isopenicillin N synthase-like dioxygenase
MVATVGSVAVGVAVVDHQSADAATLLTESLRSTGFAVLVNHPIPAELITRVQQEWLAFFESDAKFDFLPAPGHQDGFHPMSVAETAVGADAPDLKEFFHWYPWGRQPPQIGPSAAELHRLASSLGAEVLGWVERSTPPEVASGFPMPLAPMLEGSTRTLLRILRYPPLTGDEPSGSVRSTAHEDVNLLTVLPAATDPGLQVRDIHGRWYDVPGDPGSVVINAGDMLQLISGGFYPSTTHRVVNPEGEAARRSRVSTPLFLHPADQVELAPGVTAFGFLRERLLRIRGIELAEH